MIRFVSTRGGAPAVSFSEALEAGLAPDGGLWVPERVPWFQLGEFDGLATLPAVGARALGPLFEGDGLEPALDEICRRALAIPAPLVHLEGAAVLELFHGPTAAFKDFGARFLAECMAGLDGAPRTILVATSGDTGGAVAAAFHGRSGIKVGILFPQDGVSALQRRQLTSWGGNVHSFAVRGTFDDCQRVLKEALADAGWRRDARLTTANSVNIARLLPQTVYYAAASLRYVRERGAVPDFLVPTGNLGNATAAILAKRMGFPLGEIVLVTNANRTIPDYLATGVWEPRASIRTLANAMDVGDPSNMERVLAVYPKVENLREEVSAVSVDDDAIRRAIADGHRRWGRVFDPHTATALHALEQRARPHQVVVATAHPAKFPDVVGPLIGTEVEAPRSFGDLQFRPTHEVEIEPDLRALEEALR